MTDQKLQFRKIFIQVFLLHFFENEIGHHDADFIK